MAYTTINKPTDHFNTVTYSGSNSSKSVTGVGFQPDWVWMKQRSGSTDHKLADAVRGANKNITSNSSAAETTHTYFTSFDSDGFTLDGNVSDYNKSGLEYASWNWKAGGTAPTITYVVKVVSDSGNKYRFDDFGTSAVTLDLQEGGVYTFDQSDSSNSGHPLRFSTTSNGTHGGGTEYTTGVVVTGTPGNAGAKTVITVAASAPTLYYYCTQHSGMGGQANTNSTFGSSNFSGSIQTTVSANTTAGFSIVKYTGNGTAGATIGHGLNAVPKMIITKDLGNGYNWTTYNSSLGATKYLYLSATNASATYSGHFNDTEPTSSLFTVGTDASTNGNGNSIIAYCFAEKTGYSKFGSYTGNGSNDGTFIFCGFKPAFVLQKRYSSSENWHLFDNVRDPFNAAAGADDALRPNLSNAEISNWGVGFDFLSNGFKARATDGAINQSGGNYIYMAFAEAPLVGSNNIPCTAR